MAKKKAVKYMADEEVKKDEFVKEVYDLISEKYYSTSRLSARSSEKSSRSMATYMLLSL